MWGVKTDPSVTWVRRHSRNGVSPADGVVDAMDVTLMVNRYKNLPGTPPGTWCALYGHQPTQGVNFNIDAMDIVMVINAYKGFACPFSGPSAPAPCP